VTYIGIDPGQSGGMAVLTETGVYGVNSFKDKTLRDIYEMFDFSEEMTVSSFAFIENVHSMPKQGVSSSFKFGQNFGRLEGILTAKRIPFDYVLPQKWQKEMGCLSRGDKNVTKAKAQSLFPSEKITHQVADALLLADYCRRVKRA